MRPLHHCTVGKDNWDEEAENKRGKRDKGGIMSDEYSAVLTGGLSLKGGLFKSKKKKKGKRKREETEAADRAREAAIEDERSSGSAADGADAGGSGSDDGAKKDGAGEGNEQAGEDVDDMLTPAQRRFRKKQLEREGKKIRGMVKQTHRERIENFNALLASMTEHNDIPRCSAAGNG
ncbi:unnamed protein product [Ectocarpus sp. CCAP 1310/34]|nr:unnamed protein product [Ectocarpus sp. CCAP 1310/34]